MPGPGFEKVGRQGCMPATGMPLTAIVRDHHPLAPSRALDTDHALGAPRHRADGIANEAADGGVREVAHGLCHPVALLLIRQAVRRGRGVRWGAVTRWAQLWGGCVALVAPEGGGWPANADPHAGGAFP